jgi:hypothetical protein
MVMGYLGETSVGARTSWLEDLGELGEGDDESGSESVLLRFSSLVRNREKR